MYPVPPSIILVVVAATCAINKSNISFIFYAQLHQQPKQHEQIGSVLHAALRRVQNGVWGGEGNRFSHGFVSVSGLLGGNHSHIQQTAQLKSNAPANFYWHLSYFPFAVCAGTSRHKKLINSSAKRNKQERQKETKRERERKEERDRSFTAQCPADLLSALVCPFEFRCSIFALACCKSLMRLACNKA